VDPHKAIETNVTGENYLIDVGTWAATRHCTLVRHVPSSVGGEGPGARTAYMR
jgi:hypothetical protein